MRFAVSLILLIAPLAQAAEPRPVSFQQDLAPLLLERCQGCHGPDKIKGGYRLDTFEKLLQPGESGVTPITPGRPDTSELYRLLATSVDEDRMPNKGEPLTTTQINLFKRWIEDGAKYDGPSPTASLTSIAGDREPAAPPEVYRQPIPITALAFSPDASILAASGYHEVTLWDPATGHLVGRIPRMAERVFSLDFSPDGKRLAVAAGQPGSLGEVRLCDVEHRKAHKPLDRLSDVVLVVKFSPDGSLLAAGGADNLIRLYDVATGKRLQTIEEHADWVTGLAFSPDGTKLASASRDKSARVVNVRDGEPLAAYLGHEEAVYAVGWASDGKSLLSAGHDRKIHAWVLAESKGLGRIVGLSGDPLQIAIAGPHAFVCTTDGLLRQYNVNAREPLRDYVKSGDWLYSVAVNDKQHWVAAGGYSGGITLWDTATGAKLRGWLAAPGYLPAPH